MFIFTRFVSACKQLYLDKHPLIQVVLITTSPSPYTCVFSVLHILSPSSDMHSSSPKPRGLRGSLITYTSLIKASARTNDGLSGAEAWLEHAEESGLKLLSWSMANARCHKNHLQ